jgi:hypothetical protein
VPHPERVRLEINQYHVIARFTLVVNRAILTSSEQREWKQTAVESVSRTFELQCSSSS